MLSDDEILGLWAEGRPQAPARPVLGSKKVVDFARAIERAAYERAAQECETVKSKGGWEDYDEDYDNACRDCIDAIRALRRQHD